MARKDSPDGRLLEGQPEPILTRQAKIRVRLAQLADVAGLDVDIVPRRRSRRRLTREEVAACLLHALREQGADVRSDDVRAVEVRGSFDALLVADAVLALKDRDA